MRRVVSTGPTGVYRRLWMFPQHKKSIRIKPITITAPEPAVGRTTTQLPLMGVG